MEIYKCISINEIETNIKNDYSLFLKDIQTIENKLIDIINNLKKINPNWLKNADVRVGVFDRYISTLVSTRISLQLMYDYINKPDWEKDYIMRFQPTRIPISSTGYIYLKEYDLSLRFSHFQNLFSQFESTIKNISYHLKSINVTATDKWIKFIIETLKIRKEDDDLLTIIREMRNSIHNNGLFIEKKDIPKKTHKGYEFKFNHKKTIDLDWNKLLFLTNEIIDLTLEIIKSKKIESQDIIKSNFC